MVHTGYDDDDEMLCKEKISKLIITQNTRVFGVRCIVFDISEFLSDIFLFAFFQCVSLHQI